LPSAPRVTTLSYDAAGRIDSVSLPNDLAHSFGFDFGLRQRLAHGV
jgi:hypothetical protein